MIRAAAEAIEIGVPGAIERIQVMRQQPSDPDARDSRVYSLYTPPAISPGST